MNYRELIGLLRSAETVEEIDEKREEIAQFIPKVRIMFDFDQQHETHQYDLWFHTLHVVTGLPRMIPDDSLYLAALLHDIGKPDCQVRGKRPDDPNMHYFGHPHRSMQIVRDEILPDLEKKGVQLSAEERANLLFYVEYHDEMVSVSHRAIKRLLRKREEILIGGPTADGWMKTADYEKLTQIHRRLMFLQVADAKAHVTELPKVMARVEVCEELAGETGLRYMRDIQEREQNR